MSTHAEVTYLLYRKDYTCITDMAGEKSENSRSADIIRNWLRNRITLEFLGTWEQIYNPEFKVFVYEHFKSTLRPWLKG